MTAEVVATRPRCGNSLVEPVTKGRSEVRRGSCRPTAHKPDGHGAKQHRPWSTTPALPDAASQRLLAVVALSISRTAQPPRGHCFGSNRLLVKQARRRRKSTTPTRPSFSATSSASRALATPTDITASPARRSWASCAARHGRPPWHFPPPAPRSSPLLRTCHRAVAKDDRRPTHGQRQDRPAPRRSLCRPPALLREAQRGGAVQRQDQGPRHHRGRPRLVPSHGARPDEPFPRLCTCRAQLGCRRRVRGAPSRKRPSLCCRPGAEGSSMTTQAHRRPRRHRLVNAPA